MQAWLQHLWSEVPPYLRDTSTWIALLDIFSVYYLLYRGLLLLKGTKAVRMLLGLLAVMVVYFVARLIELKTLTWILDLFFQSFILVVLILFQDDIRRALSRFGIDPFGRQSKLSEAEAESLNELKKAVGTLSTRKIGALVVIERDADISDIIQEGTELDARVSEELLFSIFLPYSPLHDGAVIIHKGKITRAACFLPLTQDPSISKHLGTRHRAAIGLTESTDALVVVVSETDGKISLCRDGLIQRGHDPSSLHNELLSILQPHKPKSKEAKRKRSEKDSAERPRGKEIGPLTPKQAEDASRTSSHNKSRKETPSKERKATQKRDSKEHPKPPEEDTSHPPNVTMEQPSTDETATP